MEKTRLKELLTQIRKNDYKVPEEINPYALSLDMMDYIGDVDPELRDDLILSNLYKWIIDGVLSNEEVYNLYRIALDHDHLLKGLGTVDDLVFTRTFSVLVIAIIIFRHREKPFLSKEDIVKGFKRVVQFYNEDYDVRGYIESKGWAHGAAHGADALDEFARCEELGYEDLITILEIIYQKVNVNHYGYIHFEDERMITAVMGVLERQMLNKSDLIDWVNKFKKLDEKNKLPEDLVLKVNVTSFLKSLFFRLNGYDEQYHELCKTIGEILQELNPFSNN